MREVKELCEHMLDTPALPMTSPEHMLTLADRARRRHRGRYVAGLAAVAVFGAGTSMPILLDRPAPAPTMAATNTSTAVTVEALDGVLAVRVVQVDDITRAFVFYRTPATAPTGDLCQAPTPEEFHLGPLQDCEVLQIEGKPVVAARVSLKSGVPASRVVPVALRFENGYAVLIVESSPRAAWPAPDKENVPPREPTATPAELAEMLGAVAFK